MCGLLVCVLLGSALEFYRRSVRVDDEMAEMELEATSVSSPTDDNDDRNENDPKKKPLVDEDSSVVVVVGGVENSRSIANDPTNNNTKTVSHNDSDKRNGDDRHEEKFTWRRMFTDADLRRPLIVGCMLGLIQQFSGVNAVRR